MFKGIIRTLVEAKKTTYTHIGFESSSDKWMDNIFSPSNEDEFQTLTLDPLIKFTNTSNINGIIINCPPIYYNVSKIGKFIFLLNLCFKTRIIQ